MEQALASSACGMTLGCGIIRDCCRWNVSSHQGGEEHNGGDDPRGGQVSGNSMKEAYRLPGSTPYRRKAKDHDRKRGKFLTRKRSLISFSSHR